MDDRTADLRDLFVETTGAESVTDEQTAPRGSLPTGDEDAVDERLRELVAEMIDRYEFVSDLEEPALCRAVRAFFDPDTVGAGPASWSAEADAAVASSLPADTDAESVFDARMDLHLVADADRDAAPVPYAELRGAVLDAVAEHGESTGGTDAGRDRHVAAALSADGVDSATVRRYRRVVEADLASRRANHRYRDAFTELLTDADLSARLATDARRDGLEEATEDIETDVSL